MSPRLTLARAEGLLPDGPVAVFRPPVGTDLSAFDPAMTQVVTGDRVAWRHWAAMGFEPVLTPAEGAVVAVVCLPRSKAFARALIAQAAALGGPVLVDGAKTDGIESVLKEVKARAGVGAVISKAHGKAFVTQGAFAEWHLPPTRAQGHWTTAPAGFSADGPDPGSVLLAEAMPPLSGVVWDIGAGWGYLSAGVLRASEKVSALCLLEAEHDALEAARANVTDPRASFHWIDALHEAPDQRPTHIVMNPPFHQGRSAEPGLGQAFVARAAKALPRHGTLWMVANRHLPYERALSDAFAQVEEIGGDTRYKLTRASKPRGKRS